VTTLFKDTLSFVTENALWELEAVTALLKDTLSDCK
jgi:hypothetical protein